MTAKALVALILSACAYDTRFEDCTVRCTADAECPVGLACKAEGLCRTPDATETCARVLETPPSCAALAAVCGPNADEDCCSTATPISGGTFFRSYDVASDGMYPSTSYPATVSPFVLDKYEVTVGRFRSFVNAGAGTRVNPPTPGAGSRFLNDAPDQGGWAASWNENLAADSSSLVAAVKCDVSFQSWTDVPAGNEDLPISCVTWYEAFAFCVWDGGFLPTETAWNFAAAGGSEQRAYPWSSPAGSTTIDCSYANYHNDTNSCVNQPNGAVNRVGSESPKGDGKWGQSDLAGNVWEWTLDWYASPYGNPCPDCANVTPATFRVFRGGYFNAGATLLRAGGRGDFFTPTTRNYSFGVRCARPVP